MPQLFVCILHGLGELQRRGQLVTANMCVNERSYRSLPEYPELLAQYGVRQLHVDIVRPESTGERDQEYLREIMPRYSDMAPYYDEMLARFEQWDPDFDVNVGNLPYCILPKWGSRIHHGGQETVTKSADAAGLEDAMNKYEWHGSLRTYLPGCDDCVFRSRCTGIFRVYLELHGGDEFKPVSREALLALDPERRNFVLLVEPHLRALRAALAARNIPPSWRTERESSEDRRRRVEIAFVHDAGARARFVLTAPGRGRAPMITCDAYDVDVEVDAGVPEDDFATLLKWVHARLAEASEAAMEAPHPCSLRMPRATPCCSAAASASRSSQSGWRRSSPCPAGTSSRCAGRPRPAPCWRCAGPATLASRCDSPSAPAGNGRRSVSSSTPRIRTVTAASRP